ncbi:replicative DNA helicase [Tolypothrix sp. FACHB-123]|uniref:replicative DNA helicase n=1 Tax=Tolypothrix sp. FACHB-123 TaxID=2692868 RepID=UPI001683EF7E|nr:replicative DNA helicase [Tolypothrix sp. FACHB-123]MBD2359310.1 replicative DNA helicase [Tolypothrix sp. FACHB-123]
MAEELSFQGDGSERLPPQNIEAEEAILGGILLDSEAIGRVSDRLIAEAFYISAHKEIYQAASRLHAQGKPTDLLSVTSWLADNNMLNRIGGRNKLATLVDRTVSAVNIDALAVLVMDKYMRRQLIKAGNEIVHLGYETDKDLPRVLDQAEQKVFGVTQEKVQSGLIHISDVLINNFQDIEERNQGISLPGIPCGFYDLDAMTSGFQRSDLIIVAARPAMGKTSFAMNLAQYIAHSEVPVKGSDIVEMKKLPVAVFSLEMSKEQLVQRLLASEAGIESGYLRSGRLSQAQWEPLSLAISKLSDIPLFIDDTPNITVTQMRSQARRLQAEQGINLGLIVIDYLQLMEGAGDNRVQELSKITRSLKGLARELSVPVIALSQLSRGVEARTNKRPMLSDLRESGCLSGDSLVTLADTGLQVPIKELVGKSGFSVLALNENTMQLEKAIVSHAFSTGVKPVFTLKTRLGRTIRATANHKFLTVNGWRRLDNLAISDRLALPHTLPSHYLKTQNLILEKDSTLTTVTKSPKISLLEKNDVYWDEIVSIEFSGEEEVFDLTVPGLHNFVANNIIVHNSIEQDADLVIMLYRDDYYNNDTPDRGIAEVIVAKHRNGPTGTVKLLFDPQFTKFKNLARPNNY